MEIESGIEISEGERLNVLANELDALQHEKFGEQGDRLVSKLVVRLRSGDRNSAKILCGNEADKFSRYRDDGLPLIIEKLYGGTGSPWPSVERKMEVNKSTESSK